jgi:hypothetical protein
MSDKHWYQDGWRVLIILIIVGFVYLVSTNKEPPTVYPRLAGRVEQPFLGSPSFVVTVFHQHPASLRNVILRVKLSQEIALDHREWPEQVHSFETWPPNRDHAVSFTFPLTSYDPQKDLGVEATLEGKEIKRSVSFARWVNGGWAD